MIRVFKTGRHAKRTPLSYPALWSLFEAEIELVERPEMADLYLFAHVMDIQEAPENLVLDWRRRRRPVVLLSEEPFWDTIWGGRPLEPVIFVETDYGALPVHQLNHSTSEIFRFARIPYYLLTNPRFENAYRQRFRRNVQRSLADWQAAFAARPKDISFMFERRPESYHAVSWPDAGLIGLCSWRTELAEACHGARVERLGQSWQGGQTRFELKTDWHMDKLIRLDDRPRLMGALENTHQRDYVTEKFFDAFACGALPVYYAGPEHRIHDFGLPAESWVNLHGLTPPDAARKLMSHRVGRGELEAFCEAQRALAGLMGDPDVWQEERPRLGLAVLAALEGLL